MSANGTIGYFVMTKAGIVTLTSPIPPLVVIVILSGTIAYTFLSIFSFSSDAILQSYLLDEELRFAGMSRPEYMQEFAEAMKKKKNADNCCCCGSSKKEGNRE